jgi:3-dehydroquinate synthetase
MRHDKKNDDAQINFTLLKCIGEAEYDKTALQGVIEDAMLRYNAYISKSSL